MIRLGRSEINKKSSSGGWENQEAGDLYVAGEIQPVNLEAEGPVGDQISLKHICILYSINVYVKNFPE